MSDSIDSCIDSKKALAARVRGSCLGNRYSVGFSTVMRVDGYWGKTFDYFRPK